MHQHRLARDHERIVGGDQSSEIGGPQDVLAAEQMTGFLRGQLAALDLAGRSVCVLVPDGTRTCPLPLLIPAIHAELHGASAASPFLSLSGPTPP